MHELNFLLSVIVIFFSGLMFIEFLSWRKEKKYEEKMRDALKSEEYNHSTLV